MNARVIGHINHPTAHARDRMNERFYCGDPAKALQDVVKQLNKPDRNLIGYGAGCRIYKVLLFGVFPMRAYVSNKTGKIITITRMRRKK